MDNLFQRILGAIGLGSASPEPKSPRRAHGTSSSVARQAAQTPQQLKSPESPVGRAEVPRSSRPRSTTEDREMSQRVQDRMSSSAALERVGAKVGRSAATSSPPPASPPASPQRRASGTSSLTPNAASSPAVLVSSSPSSADAPDGRNPIVSSPSMSNASSHRRVDHALDVLPRGRMWTVDDGLAGKNSSGSARSGGSQSLIKPLSAVLPGCGEEGTAKTDGVRLDESAHELEKVFEGLLQRYALLLNSKRRRQTELEYRNVARRAIDRADSLQLANYPRRARAKVRAAVIVVGIGEIRATLKALSERRENIGPDVQSAVVADAYRWVEWIRAVEVPVAKDGDPGNKMTRCSARRKLRALPFEWELKLFETARAYPNWFAGICASLAIGLRPVELERGILIRRMGQNIEFVVQTAKSCEHREGIGKRSLLMSAETPWVQALATELGDRTEMVIKWRSAKKSCDALVVIGRKAFPDLKEKISGYVFRHRFACILKREKWPPIQIAKALGHSSTRQLSSYGVWNGVSRGGALPLRVTAERLPRQIEKPRDFISGRRAQPRGSVS